MVALTEGQKQSYINLLKQANLHPFVYKSLIPVLRSPAKSIDDLNALCAQRTKIDISVFEAITSPQVAKPEIVDEVKPIVDNTTPIIQEETPTLQPTVDPAPATPVIDTTSIIEEVVLPAADSTPIVETKPVKPHKTHKFNFGDKANPASKKTVTTEAVATAVKFFTCDDNQVQRTEPTAENKDSKNVAASIEKCNTWQIEDLYVVYKAACLQASDTIVAKAACYVAMIPQDIAPQNDSGVAVYSCDNNVKADAPFTYSYSSEQGKAQHLRDCAAWVVDGGYSLAYGEGNCADHYSPEAALNACIGLL